MRDAKKDEYVFLGLLLIPTIWFALLIAPYMDKGLINAIPYLNEALNHPFQIQWTNSTLKTIGIFLIIYVLGVGMYLSSSKNYRRTEEYGSAKWANPNTVCKKYANKDYFANKVFSQNVRMGLDGKKHRRNLNTVVIGALVLERQDFMQNQTSCSVIQVLLYWIPKVKLFVVLDIYWKKMDTK